MKKYFGVVLVLVVIVIYLSGCFFDLVIPGSDLNSEDTGDGVVLGKGTLKIYLTDIPGDYLEVNIIISKIEGHIALEDEEGYWEILKEWPDGLPVDLIKLEDRFMLLASLELKPNKYTQLRLFLMDEEEDTLIAWIVLKGSELKIPLEIPSVYQTGIKLNRPFEIIEGWITKLTIDFDADKSVVKTGNEDYKLKPVIHMTSEIYLEEGFAEGLGSVYGTVFYVGGDLGFKRMGGASVNLSGGEYIFVYNTTTPVDGSFNFLDNVPVGNCVLFVYADGFNDYFESIVVEDGVDIEVDVVLSFEETGGISGIVKDLDSGNLIEGATVNVTLSGGSTYSFESSTKTDDDGYYGIGDIPFGEYEVAASATGYYTEAFEPVSIDSDEVITVDFELEPEE